MTFCARGDLHQRPVHPRDRWGFLALGGARWSCSLWWPGRPPAACSLMRCSCPVRSIRCGSCRAAAVRGPDVRCSPYSLPRCCCALPPRAARFAVISAPGNCSETHLPGAPPPPARRRDHRGGLEGQGVLGGSGKPSTPAAATSVAAEVVAAPAMALCAGCPETIRCASRAEVDRYTGLAASAAMSTASASQPARLFSTRSRRSGEPDELY